MLELIALVALLGTLSLFAFVGLQVTRILDKHLSNLLSLHTRRLEHLLNPTPPTPKPPLPGDLMKRAMEESEEWARDQFVAHLYELHDRLQDWDAVRMIVLTSANV